ncbi:lysylphosphatidylglycerol synthase transmembrane domain-containing protein [Azohydromonas lata]|uniref:YbhN family protein n=1 Tax=Azohydromonas lata TaxID=45677 RepID=A0ABU5II36_9BURK|nr:YbhN family protein [Azohydromonas lata]MDZ5458807.1 YbhN family protein [Azohydromonas lata]
MERAVARHAPPAHPWAHAWAHVRRPLLVLTLLALLSFIAWRARSLDWAAAWAALLDYRPGTLLLAALTVAAAHALYTGYDLLGRFYSGHHLSAPRVAATAFVSFAANLNLGSMVGGVALRLRLYARQGLPMATIVRVWGISLLTNWIGYAALAGAVFASGLVHLPPDAPLSPHALRLVGAALLAVVGLYLAACRWSRRRLWTLRGHRLELPRAGLALAQVGLSALHWSFVAGVLYVLLHGGVDYPTVLGALMLTSMAVIALRVPAGLGVLEAVFMSLLAGRQPEAQLLAALLAYRALFYLLPLAVAALVYLGLEARLRRGRAAAARQPRTARPQS